jgi:hypothetical protein
MWWGPGCPTRAVWLRLGPARRGRSVRNCRASDRPDGTSVDWDHSSRNVLLFKEIPGQEGYFVSALGGIRTPNLLIRSQML